VPIDRDMRTLELPKRVDGKVGWRHHWQHGIIGALCYWACGSLGAVVFMIAACAQHFNVVHEARSPFYHPTAPPIARHPCHCPATAPSPPSMTCLPIIRQVGVQLGLKRSKQEVEQAQVDAYIVLRVKAVLAVLKNCATEEARIEYGILLAALAPERLAERAAAGMMRKVAARLGVQRGTRSYSKSIYYLGRYTGI
jgi:hypothetical protein